MAEIICPNCGKAFELEDNGYAQIAQQVRGREFERELDRYKETLLREKETERQLGEKKLREDYEATIRKKDEEIAYYKDFKKGLSTKAVGESLEQYCLNTYNAIRTVAFPRAYFEKDNDSRTGSKGDFIFRDYGEDGTEFISIMFEMKNELDATASKHKNEDFFKELDKDRKEKNCEYAVLVSLLEADNDFYNSGIVDVSYRYEKMYVIRPQCLIAIISLLRNAALNSLQYRQELALVRRQQIDLSTFEDNIAAFKDGIMRSYNTAAGKFKAAIDDIDKTVRALEKIKEELISCSDNLRMFNDKTQKITIKKLTKNAPQVEAMLDKIRSDKEE